MIEMGFTSVMSPFIRTGTRTKQELQNGFSLFISHFIVLLSPKIRFAVCGYCEANHYSRWIDIISSLHMTIVRRFLTRCFRLYFERRKPHIFSAAVDLHHIVTTRDGMNARLKLKLVAMQKLRT
jgi:hypothetical protein